METHEERMTRLRKVSQDAAAAADTLLAEELGALQKATQADLAALRPKVQDKASFDLLVQAVSASTKANEDLAQLKQRITALGKGVAGMAQAVVTILKS